MNRTRFLGLVLGLGLLVACSSTSGGNDGSSGGQSSQGGSSDQGAGAGTGGQNAGTVTPTEPWSSGPRLRARVVSGGNGAAQFLGWHDTELNVDCAFKFALDGVMRCLPTAWAAAEPTYTDANCQQRVLMVSQFQTPEPFGEEVDFPEGFVDTGEPSLCAPDVKSPVQEHVFKVGDRIEPEMLFQLDTNGQCQAVDASLYPTSYSAAQLIPVDPSAFVGATIHEEPVTSIGARWLAAEDGSYEVQSLVDPGGDLCGTIELENSSICVTVHSRRASLSNGFADAECKVPVVQLQTNTGCSDSALLIVDSAASGECAATSRTVMPTFYAATPLDQRYDFGPTTQTGGLGCFAMGSGEGYFAKANPIDPATLPTVSLLEQGTGRLRARFGKSATGIPARNPDDAQTGQTQIQFFDTVRNELCSPGDTVEGRRCLPLYAARYNDQEYLDAGCTMPAIEVGPNDCLSQTAPVVLETPMEGDTRIGSFVQATGTELVDTFYTLITEPGKVDSRGPCVLETDLAQRGIHVVAAERHLVTELAEVSETTE